MPDTEVDRDGNTVIIADCAECGAHIHYSPGLGWMHPRTGLRGCDDAEGLARPKA